MSVPTNNQFEAVTESLMLVSKKSIPMDADLARFCELGTGYQYIPGISATYDFEKIEPSLPNNCPARRGTLRSMK
ncbi:MAG: hypothetical protein F4227_05725 [Gammaproteobacteria bacterium]|nr:hypothetical protein [Gammaproteobacteria bacterium]